MSAHQPTQVPSWLLAQNVFSRYEDIVSMYYEWINCGNQWYLGRPGTTINSLLQSNGYTFTADICVLYQSGHFLYRYIYTVDSLRVYLKSLNKAYHSAYNRAMASPENAIEELQLDIDLRRLANRMHAMYNVIYPNLKLTSLQMMKRHNLAIGFLEDMIKKIEGTQCCTQQC